MVQYSKFLNLLKIIYDKMVVRGGGIFEQYANVKNLQISLCPKRS